ncbi:MAG: GMC family oxidoreductase N-terminal domain-containing protein [Alphaproteobacteria bacterium]|nr:GMC family oxidoreductase N-terminal domain-containing protein [Alphaproteobacteria bacterium]
MYDYVIVGGGSAGCVLAARLSEDPSTRVLLLEAGSEDKDPYIHMPVGFAKMTAGPHIWGYKTTPQRHADDREITLPQGRVIGGGSSVNAEVFTRGCPEDYDRWANDEGCAGWSFDEVKPDFLKSEDNDTLAGEHHGTGGPLGVSTLDAHPLTRRFVQACQQAGIPYTADFNGPSQAGCGAYQVTTRHARRCSTATGYLRPAISRKNLEVRTDCVTQKLLIEDGRATGVSFFHHGQAGEVRAEREVIVTAGAIGSPKLLMLSGIGPADHLKEHGIEVVLDLQGVGRNLQDHFDVDIVYELTGPHGFDKYNSWPWMLWAGLQYKLFKSGPVASNIVEGGAFWYADKRSKTPDTQFHFLPAAGVEAGVPPVPSGHGCTLNSYFLRPRSRGSVRLTSAEVYDPPAVDPNYIADEHDLKMTVKGLKMMRAIMGQPALAPFIKTEHYPGADVTSEQGHIDYVRQHGRTSYHPVGTCKMGSDALAVVDPELRVRGIECLRVCDSSVMPSIVSSNTNAPTIMIGEKAADLIRGNR